MENKIIRTDLLRQLAAHIISDKRGHKEFDFSKWNNNSNNTCGTTGCAAGELPILFPNDWEFGYAGLPRLKKREKHSSILENLDTFFNITRGVTYHLFNPNGQLPKKYGGKKLDGSATAEDVAANMIEFCDKVDKGDIKL